MTLGNNPFDDSFDGGTPMDSSLRIAASSTMGDEMRERQSKSLISVVAVFTTTTELSVVDRKTSGCLEPVRVRGSTAIEAYE